MLRRQAISTIVHAAIVFFALTWACLAQGMLEPGAVSSPKYGIPGPVCAADIVNLMTPEPYSSFDQHNGFYWGWSYAFKCFALEPPKLAIGPGNIPSDIPLTQNVFTALDGAIGSGGGAGFRAGAQYPPAGVWALWGIVTFTTTTATSNYELEVTMGTVDAGGTQKNILTGSPTVVGGGGGTSGAGGVNYQLTYLVPKMQCNAPYGKSCEVRVLVRTSDAGGTAKTKTTNLPVNVVTANTIVRFGGLDQLQ